MATQFGWIPPVGYPDDIEKQVNKFTDLIIKTAPESIEFSNSDIHQKLKLTGDELNWFNQINHEIWQNLEHKGYVVRDLNSLIFRLTEKAINVKNKIDPISASVNHIHLHGNNYGQLIQDSRLENSPSTISVAETPKKNETQSIILKFWNLINEYKIVTGIIVALILAYLKKQTLIEWLNHLLN